VDGEERTRLLKESSLLVLPSYFENMPNLVLEAMAAGEAVAASRVGAVPEMLDSEAAGFLFPPGDVAALEASLRQALGEGSRLGELGVRNQEVIRRRYTLSVVEERLEAIYRALAGSPAPAAGRSDSDPAAADSASGPAPDVGPLRGEVGSR
jgi:glycosyltransferase involved in cell wall biosynthesis